MKSKVILIIFLFSFQVFSEGISLENDASKQKISNIFFDSNEKYYIYSKPLFQTVITFNKEIVEYAEFGDNIRWHLAEDLNLIRLKPTDSGLITDLIVKTDRNIYYFVVTSTEEYYNPVINFKEKQKIKTEEKIKIPKLAIGIENFNNSYTISKEYLWTPTQIIDDGNKTYFIMPKNIQELPSFLIKNEDNSNNIVNFRITENTNNKILIVDRVFSKGILKLGKKQVIIKNRKYNF